MITLEQLCQGCGVDLSKIDPRLSDTDTRIEMANQAVTYWMSKPENKSYLDRKKADYLHDKGWSVGKNLKHECDIPNEAFVLLPSEIRNNPKEIMLWVNKYHPYLLHKKIV